MSVFKAGKYTLPLGERTYVMGILNVTPDSFSDGGKWNNVNLAIKRAHEIEEQGADILDIGAQSTRPGYERISIEEEMNRLVPVLEGLRDKLSIPVSIDTFYPEVAERALELGADIINDVTGFRDKNMMAVASKSNCGCIIMHDQLGINIKPFFENQLKIANEYGIEKERICFDTGIGFGKTYEENLYVLKHHKDMIVEGCATLIGASRKRVIGQPCGNPPFDERLAGTIAAHTIAMVGGADIIRVHDVAEAVQAAKVADAILHI